LSWAFSSMVKQLRVMEKKLTNSGPLRESVDKHSIYTIKVTSKQAPRNLLIDIIDIMYSLTW